MNKFDEMLFVWVISLLICSGIEIMGQVGSGIIGIGIIASIFMSIMFIYSFLREKLK